MTTKHTMKDLEAAEAAMNKARYRFMNMRDEIEARDVLPMKKKLVGKCFKYRTSFSNPQKPSDYWHIWVKITGPGKGWMVDAAQIQRDKHGVITVERRSIFAKDGTMGGLYIPITRHEYNRAVRVLLRRAAVIVQETP